MPDVKLQKSPNGFRIIVDGVEGDWTLNGCLGTTVGADGKIYGAEPTSGEGDLDIDVVYEMLPVKVTVETLPEDNEEVEDLLEELEDDDDDDEEGDKT